MTPVADSHQRLFRNGLAVLYRGQAMPGKLVIINNFRERGDKDGEPPCNTPWLRQGDIFMLPLG